MLYEIAHFLRDKTPGVWDCASVINSVLFSMRYGKKILQIESAQLSISEHGYGLTIKNGGNLEVLPIRKVATEALTDFFSRQPIEAYRFFKPHGFDKKSINKLQRDRAFLGYVLMDVTANRIVGYCFNRSFFFGKGFRGRLVDIDCRGRGLGTMMNCLLNEVGFGIGLRLFETVSKDNVASYRSAISASDIKVVAELPHNELYLEIMNSVKLKNGNDANPIGGGSSCAVILQPLFVVCNRQERRAA